MKCVLGCAAALLGASSALGSVITVDFETDDDFITPFVNGQDLSTPPEFGTFFSLSTSGNNLGAAVFDSSPAGPNAGGPDPDLLVGLGNILILQDPSSPTQTVPGVFNTPNDALHGGTIAFDFTSAVELRSLDLVDINGNGPVFLTLIDGGGLTRSYSVPMHWTMDPTVAPNGWQTLDLTTLAAQLGEGGGTATAMEDAGFSASGVVRLEVQFTGSAGLDNLVFIPAPGSALLLGIGMLGVARRRR